MIRPYHLNDSVVLNELMKNFKIPFSLNNNTLVVFEEENNIVGFIDYTIITDRMEINYIFVCESNRNKLIATKLIKYLINESEKMKLLNITLEVAINNEKAINLYKKFGFIIVATRKNYYKNIDAYLMMRE